MSDSGLKPCPFCGSEASMARDYCADSGGTFLSIKCSGCRAQSGEKYHSRGNDCPQTYQEVRDAWSRRADLRAPDPRVLALVEAARALQSDMMERAQLGIDTIKGEQYRVVNAGNSAWAGFCAALASWNSQAAPLDTDKNTCNT